MAATIDHHSPPPSDDRPAPGQDHRLGRHPRRSIADRVASTHVNAIGIARWLGRHPVVLLGIALGIAVVDSVLNSLG